MTSPSATYKKIEGRRQYSAAIAAMTRKIAPCEPICDSATKKSLSQSVL